MLGSTVPDLRWTIENIQMIGEQIVVRVKDRDTQSRLVRRETDRQELYTMAIDIFTVKNGKAASTYDVENRVGALEQIGKEGQRTLTHFTATSS